MIVCYEGLLGGGKTYHAVKYALQYMASGGHVFTNILLVREPCEKYCRMVHGREIRFEEQYHHVPNENVSHMHEYVIGGTPEAKTLAIFDELHLFLNARDWAQTSRELLSWLTQTRKLYTDVVFITQHRNNVDKQFVRLVGEYWRFRDMRNWRLFFGFKTHLPLFLVCVLEADGRTLVRKRFETIDKAIFTCYDSSQLFDSIGARGLASVKVEKAKYKRWPVYLALSSFVLLPLAGCKLYKHFKGQDSPSPSPAPSSAFADVPPRPKPRRTCLIEAVEQVRTSSGKFVSANVAGIYTVRPPDVNDLYWRVWEDEVPAVFRPYIVRVD